jgi:hypothetical protein
MAGFGRRRKSPPYGSAAFCAIMPSDGLKHFSQSNLSIGAFLRKPALGGV